MWAHDPDQANTWTFIQATEKDAVSSQDYKWRMTLQARGHVIHCEIICQGKKVRTEEGRGEEWKQIVKIQMALLTSGIRLRLKTAQPLNFELREPINVPLAGASRNWVSESFNQNPWWMHVPTRGACTRAEDFSVQFPTLSSGSHTELRTKQELKIYFCKKKETSLLLKNMDADNWLIVLYRSTHGKMHHGKKNILAKKKCPWILFPIIMLRVLCSELSTEWPCDIYQAMKPLWRTVTYVYINREKMQKFYKVKILLQMS